jgi:hypothetical protein
MGTQTVQMKGVLPWLVRVGLVVPVKETFILPWLLWSPSTKKVSSPYTISIYVRAGSPVSDCVSPVLVYRKQYILYSL